MQQNPETQAAVTSTEQEAASVPALAEAANKPLPVAQALDAWDQVMSRAHRLLRDETIDAAWITRFTELETAIRQLTARDPDLALYVLIEANGSNVDHYSAQHAMTCMVIAELAAEWMEWPQDERRSLALAALSMNLSITALQDSLAKQSTSLSDGQRNSVATHAASSADMLVEAGVNDPLWLHVVRHHHVVATADAIQQPDAGPRLSELLRRVDVYSAKLSRRGSRQSVTPAMAARDACLDASGHPDSIGATLLRVVGLYPPGTFVELANGESAVVIVRGAKAHTPVVASMRRKDGGLLMQPVRRDTLRLGFAVKRGVEPSRVRVLLNHRRILSCA
jgi:HD-GYP domain-containing protein (c-di-GMP phosphodiesterase class II)